MPAPKVAKAPKNQVFKPSVGKLFSLRKDRRIYLTLLGEANGRSTSQHFIDNRDGDKHVLVLNETTSRVTVLYQSQKFSMSKFYLHVPLHDTDSKLVKISETVQDLVSGYFAMLAKTENANVSSDFFNFGNKLKSLQETIEKTENA